MGQGGEESQAQGSVSLRSSEILTLAEIKS